MINTLEVVELAGILQRAIGEDVLFSEALPELRTFRSYNRALRRVVQNVHNARSYAETERYWNEMQSIIRYGLAEAIREGAIQGGLKSGVIPSSDRLPLDMRISTEILLSTDFINAAWDTSKTKGGTQADLTRGLRRADMWANRWKELKSLAAAIAGRVARRDGTVVQNLRWDFGKTREHCRDCSTYVGRVYKADIWFKWGALPQSRALECRGFLCQCKLTPTDERAMPGHPPKPTNAGMF